MRIITDENIRQRATDLLRAAGHDVVSIFETARRSSDTEIMAQAVRDSRILITQDKGDFGWLIYDQGLPPPPALLLFRISELPAARQPHFIRDSVGARSDWQGYFWVIQAGRARATPFPD